jgi:hypothetical protein
MTEDSGAQRMGHRRGCFGGQGSRALTIADRLPRQGDRFRTSDGTEFFFIGSSLSGGSRITSVERDENDAIVSVRIQTGDVFMPDGGTEFQACDLMYINRADGGEVTVRE